MKSKSQTTRNLGFTIVEVLIATAIMGFFLSSIMYLYRRNTNTFKITAWKQDRTRESQKFWAIFKKNIEEATEILSVEPGVENPNIATTSAPLLFRPGIITNIDSKVLAWNVSKISFDFSSGNFAHSDESRKFYVELKKRNLFLKEVNGRILADIKDVESIEIKVESIVRAANNTEYNSETELTAGSKISAQGTLVQIAILLKPPDNYIGNVKIPQNHKFKLNVGSKQNINPFYP